VLEQKPWFRHNRTMVQVLRSMVLELARNMVLELARNMVLELRRMVLGLARSRLERRCT